jgi:hypothetical protein
LRGVEKMRLLGWYYKFERAISRYLHYRHCEFNIYISLYTIGEIRIWGGKKLEFLRTRKNPPDHWLKGIPYCKLERAFKDSQYLTIYNKIDNYSIGKILIFGGKKILFFS